MLNSNQVEVVLTIDRREDTLYKYDKLRGRIVEKYGTNRDFAKAVGISSVAMSKKLNGKIGLSQSDIISWSDLLDIDKAEYADYFFA